MRTRNCSNEKAPAATMTDDALQPCSKPSSARSPRRMPPRDAATLLLVDRSGEVPTVLMGRRHDRHKFMPGKYVFPGGRVEALRRPHADRGRTRRSAITIALDITGLRRASAQRTRGFALAAIRETCEETGLLLGRKSEDRAACAARFVERFCRRRRRAGPQRASVRRARDHAAGPAAPFRCPLLRRRCCDDRASASTASSRRTANSMRWSGFRSPRPRRSTSRTSRRLSSASSPSASRPISTRRFRCRSSACSTRSSPGPTFKTAQSTANPARLATSMPPSLANCRDAGM